VGGSIALESLLLRICDQNDPRAGGAGAGERPPAVSLTPGARSARRLGLFGGSFDPVHQGHLDVAKAARAAHGLDHVVFVPAALSPHKVGLPPAPARVRIEWLRGALTSPEIAPWASLWPIETEREPPSYTIATLRELALQRPPGDLPFLILGQDNLPGLPTWRDVTTLLSLVQPVVVQRERGVSLVGSLASVAPRLDPDAVAKLEHGLVPLAEPSPHSSTQVREALARGQDPGAALPPGIWSSIVEQGLYGHGRDPESSC